MEEIIKRLESLRDICNARSDMFVGDAKIVWTGYGKTVSDAIALIENQKRIYLALEKDWKELRNLLKDQESVEPELEGGGSTWWHVCGECHGAIDTSDNYCKHCGRRIKQDGHGGANINEHSEGHGEGDPGGRAGDTDDGRGETDC